MQSGKFFCGDNFARESKFLKNLTKLFFDSSRSANFGLLKVCFHLFSYKSWQVFHSTDTATAKLESPFLIGWFLFSRTSSARRSVEFFVNLFFKKQNCLFFFAPAHFASIRKFHGIKSIPNRSEQIFASRTKIGDFDVSQILPKISLKTLQPLVRNFRRMTPQSRSDFTLEYFPSLLVPIFFRRFAQMSMAQIPRGFNFCATFSAHFLFLSTNFSKTCSNVSPIPVFALFPKKTFSFFAESCRDFCSSIPKISKRNRRRWFSKVFLNTRHSAPDFYF